jgi:dephospho-CoA kinase
MIVLGLTGGIGMGKSTVAELLAQRGWPVVDADVLARQVVEPGQPALEEIVRLFGREILDAQGRLRREEVARRVFADASLRRRLEAITHPRIRALWQQAVAQWRRQQRPGGVLVIPLLFEVGAQSEVDVVICVACTAETQRRRLLARGWSEREIAQRLAAQMPIEQKLARADYVIWTEGELDLTARQLDCILARLAAHHPEVALQFCAGGTGVRGT